MIVYLLNNRKYFGQINEVGIAKRKTSVKRFGPKQVSNFALYIMSIWMLVIAAKIGGLLFFYYSDMLQIELQNSLLNIQLPISKSVETIGNKRLEFFLALSSDGKLKMHGSKIDIEELSSELHRIKLVIPNVSATLVIDKDCKMEFVQNIIMLLKQAKINRIFFLTKRVTFAKTV